MGLPKGRTNNPSGRPGGIPNKLTSGLRERVSNILERNIDLEAIERDLEQLDPEKRLYFLIKLLSPLRKVINSLNPCLTPRPPKGGVLNNEHFAKVPFPRVAEALAEAQGDLGVKLLFGVDSLLEFSIPKMQSIKLEADLKSELRTTNMTEQQYNELL